MSVTMSINLKEYFESEYKDTIHWMNSGYCEKWKDKQQAVFYAIQRCLGVTMFVQREGIPFKEVNTLYEEYRTKFYNLLKEI